MFLRLIRRNPFEQIHKMIHFVDQTDKNFKDLFKLETILECL